MVLQAIDKAATTLVEHRYSHWLLLLIACVSSCYFWLSPQPIGYAALVLGVELTVITALKMRPAYRVFLIFPVIALVICEFRNISIQTKQDQQEQNKRLEVILSAQNAAFAKTMDSISVSIEKLNQILVANSELEIKAKKSLAKQFEKEGALYPGNYRGPIESCDKKAAIGSTFLGGSNIVQNMVFPFEVITVDGESLLSIDKDSKGRLLISTRIFDERGELLLWMTDNEYLATTPFFDKQKSEVYVYDKRGKEVLAIQFLNKSLIYVKADFWSPSGKEIIMDDDGISYGNGSKFGHNCFIGQKSLFKI